jgi:hypothetical protein
VFAPLAARPWSVWLDSGRPGSLAGRWDILACDPWSSLVTRGGLTWIRDGGVSRSRQDPLDLLRRQLGPMAVWPPRVAALEPEGLPFGGGAIGWFGYDLGRRFERLPATALDRQGGRSAGRGRASVSGQVTLGSGIIERHFAAHDESVVDRDVARIVDAAGASIGDEGGGDVRLGEVERIAVVRLVVVSHSFTSLMMSRSEGSTM